MQKLIGYMLTWTTHGTWLQGDKRGWVDNGEILKANKKLETMNVERLKNAPVRLKHKEKEIVENYIFEQGQKGNDKIRAVSVQSNHIHVVVEGSCEDIGAVVRKYKAGTIMALRRAGFDHDRKIWGKGFDKRYCYDNKDLDSRIRYVTKHNS